MALTRKLLKGLGLSEEQIDSIIDAHTDTIEGLNAKVKKLEADAAQGADIRRELEALKGGKDYKAEAEKLKKELDDYRAEVAGKEKAEKVKNAYRQLLTEEKIDPKRYDAILKVTDLTGVKLGEDGKPENAEDLKKAIREEWAGFVVNEGQRGANISEPPAGGKVTRTKEEIMAIKDTAERQKAIAENHSLFGF